MRSDKPSKKTISSRGLAKLAGVNQSTVSRALNNHPGIPEETRKRILKLAKKHGYKRNPLISSLMHELRQVQEQSYKSTIAFLITRPKKDYLEVPLFSDFYRGLFEQANSLGYGVDLISLKEDLKKKSLARVLYMRNIRGLLLTSSPYETRYLRLNWENYAVLIQGYGILRPNFDRITANHYQNMYNILRIARRKGYRRIAYLWNPDVDRHTNNGFINAFRDYQSHIPKKDRIFFEESNIQLFSASKNKKLKAPHFEFSFSLFDKWLKKYEPDLIIPYSDYLRQIYEYKKESIPHQFGLVNYSWNNHDKVLSKISGIDENFGFIGESAANLLISKIETRQYGIPKSPGTYLLEGVWKEGKTT